MISYGETLIRVLVSLESSLRRIEQELLVLTAIRIFLMRDVDILFLDIRV